MTVPFFIQQRLNSIPPSPVTVCAFLDEWCSYSDDRRKVLCNLLHVHPNSSYRWGDAPLFPDFPERYLHILGLYIELRRCRCKLATTYNRRYEKVVNKIPPPVTSVPAFLSEWFGRDLKTVRKQEALHAFRVVLNLSQRWPDQWGQPPFFESIPRKHLYTLGLALEMRRCRYAIYQYLNSAATA